MDKRGKEGSGINEERKEEEQRR